MDESSEKRRDSLAARLKAGNRAATTEFVDIYYERIYLFMRRLGHSRQVSEDLTQESFLQAWHHISQLRDGRALDSWLYRIAANVSKLYWRRHKRTDAADLEAADLPQGSDGQEPEHNEQLRLLQRAVVGLPVKLRQAIVLHYMQQLSIGQSAQAAGIREGTFKSRLNRGLKALRTHFTQGK